MRTGEVTSASTERSGICAVPAASVVVENVLAFDIAVALMEKFGGDSLDETRQRLHLGR